MINKINTIQKENIKKEMELVQSILTKKIITKDIKQQLTNMGYTHKALGTGASAYTTSKNIAVQNIKSKYYLNGEYLVVGTCSQKCGMGNIYYGYVKQIA
jgi:hypothetical protein